MCCACGGGTDYGEDSESESEDSQSIEECQDTNGDAFDYYGDGCEYYDQDPDACENYDNVSDEFNAMIHCCVCGGGSARTCQDNEGDALDDGEQDCGYYEYEPDECGDFDTADFAASDMCCACGGGTDYGEDSESEECQDTIGDATDDADDQSYYEQICMANLCEGYDDENFIASMMCCSCGGGTDYGEDSEPEECQDTIGDATDDADDLSYY